MSVTVKQVEQIIKQPPKIMKAREYKEMPKELRFAMFIVRMTKKACK
jgi:hypothetical protein